MASEAEKGALAAAAAQAGPKAAAALDGALSAGRDPGTALLKAGLPAGDVLAALGRQYGLETVAYDERITVPPELGTGIAPAMLADGRWFPLGEDAGGAVVVLVSDPADARTAQEAAERYPGRKIVRRIALRRDIRWFVDDFLRRSSGAQIGVVRTNLAYWRNTMANWRTKLACYRTDMARARTNLNIFRWGLGIVALSNSLLRAQKLTGHPAAYWIFIGLGLAVAAASFAGYVRARRYGPPRVQTLVEVTAATMEFLEQYHFTADPNVRPGRPVKPTMLGRLGDLLGRHSTIIDTNAGFRERIHLARERNVLAAQRTVCACYRTVASRARTGLALLRTGVTLGCLGLGLLQYFRFSPLSAFDFVLILAGLAMIAEGLVWYWPVRAEPAETPRCPVGDDDED